MSISGRGGARTGGGRPSPWQHQPTCTIRVPEILAETLLEIARELDKGLEETLVIEPKSHGVNRQAKKKSYLYRSSVFIAFLIVMRYSSNNERTSYEYFLE